MSDNQFFPLNYEPKAVNYDPTAAPCLPHSAPRNPCNKPVLPAVSERPFGFPHANAAQQRREPNSMLNCLASTPREVQLTVGIDAPDQSLVNVLSEDHSHPDRRGRHRVMLEAYGYRWYRVCGLDYLLKRADIDVAAHETPTPA